MPSAATRCIRHAALAVLAAVAAALTVGCGSSTQASSPTTTVASSTPIDELSTSSREGTVPSDPGELETGLNEAGLENKGQAIVSAMDAERFEVEGNVLHVYVGSGSNVPKGTECMVVGSILSDGEVAVIHNGSQETTCE